MLIRQAYMMRLKPGGAEEYRRLHQHVPRQVLLDEAAAGAIEETIFEHDGILFGVSIVRDDQVWERARHSEACLQWALTLEPYLELGADGTAAVTPLTEIYHHRHAIPDAAGGNEA